MVPIDRFIHPFFLFMHIKYTPVNNRSLFYFILSLLLSIHVLFLGCTAEAFGLVGGSSLNS